MAWFVPSVTYLNEYASRPAAVVDQQLVDHPIGPGEIAVPQKSSRPVVPELSRFPFGNSSVAAVAGEANANPAITASGKIALFIVLGALLAPVGRHHDGRTRKFIGTCVHRSAL